jgi:hypothetical protein
MKTEKWNSLAIGVVRYASRSGKIIAGRVAVIEVLKKVMIALLNLILRHEEHRMKLKPENRNT